MYQYLLSKYYFLLYPLLAFLISTFLTKKLIVILPKLGFVDKPKDGHIHKKPTPTSGGIAIVIAFLVTSLIFLFHATSTDINSILAKLPGIYIPFIVLVIVAIADDKFGFHYNPKLICQIIVASMCWFLDIRFTNILGFHLPLVLSYALTVGWLFAFMNVFNVMDGLDGMSAGLAAISSSCMGIIFILNGKPTEAVILFVLATSALGFLRYNFFPAKIFMGEIGSTTIGYIIGVLGLVFSTKAATVTSILVPVLAAGIPWFDGSLLIWRRVAKKIIIKLSKQTAVQHVFDRDLHHIHHRVYNKFRSQAKTAKYFYLFSVLLAILAILLTSTKGDTRYLVFLIVIVVLINSIRKLAYWELWNTSQAVIIGLRRPSKKAYLSILEPIIDLGFLVTSFLFAYFIFKNVDTPYNINLARNLIICIFPILVVINISRVYKTYWLRANSDDYMYLVLVLFSGSFISMIISFFYLYNTKNFPYLFVFFVLFFLFSLLLLLGARLSLRYLGNNFIKRVFLAVHLNETTSKLLIYGGGEKCRFYVHNQFKDAHSKPVNIIGILDDMIYLKNKYIYGHKVLGGINNLDQIYDKHKFNKIIVTCNITEDEKIKRLKEFCKDSRIELCEVTVTEAKYN